MPLQKVKEAIHDLEYYNNGFKRLCGADAKILNLHRVSGGYKADVLLQSGYDEVIERYDSCFYPDMILDDWIKKP